MTTLRLQPAQLTGSIQIPSSKSMGHRELICAALAQGESKVSNISPSKDITATVEGLSALGAKFTLSKDGRRSSYLVSGGYPRVKKTELDCGESGSTLRFLLPLGALTNEEIVFTGGGALPTRPLEPYFKIFKQQGIFYQPLGADNLPLKLKGALQSGAYTLPGDVSSQFISGLLFALPLLPGNSTLDIEGKLESQSYVEMTLAALKKYGILIKHTSYKHYTILGKQHYKATTSQVEGDFSQAAFWLVAGTIGSPVKACGMNMASLQGDKAIIKLVRKMGGSVVEDKGSLRVTPALTEGTTIDATNCPDLVPVLTVLASLSKGHTEIINAGRLRLKECDRLTAMAQSLNKIGGRILEKPEGLSIEGVESFTGGTLDCWNDHRIAMSLAIASIRCKAPLILTGTECVAKSYPDFWEDFQQAGGCYE